MAAEAAGLGSAAMALGGLVANPVTGPVVAKIARGGEEENRKRKAKEEPPPPPARLPGSTPGVVSFNPGRLRIDGTMGNDEVKPTVDTEYDRAEATWWNEAKRLGISLEDLRANTGRKTMGRAASILTGPTGVVEDNTSLARRRLYGI